LSQTCKTKGQICLPSLFWELFLSIRGPSPKGRYHCTFLTVFKIIPMKKALELSTSRESPPTKAKGSSLWNASTSNTE
jgi:hypothetical protein